MAPAFLAVFSKPGDLVTLDEFQDWYNNEHVPLRLNHLKSFLSGARYSSSDKKIWAALYEIDDTSTFSHPSYTRLRETRSPRESDLIKRLEVLDRRGCEVVADSGDPLATDSAGCTGLKVGKPSEWVVTHGFDTEDQGTAVASFEPCVKKVKGLEGWVRSRMFRYIDSSKTGVGVPSGPEGQIVPRFLVLHESLSPASCDEIVRHVNEESNVAEILTWELYRAYPCIAQGNI